MGMRFTARLSVFMSILVFLTVLLALLTSVLSVYLVGGNKMDSHWQPLIETADRALTSQSEAVYSYGLPTVMSATGASRLAITDAQERRFTLTISTLILTSGVIFILKAVLT